MNSHWLGILLLRDSALTGNRMFTANTNPKVKAVASESNRDECVNQVMIERSPQRDGFFI
ncbi:MAG TPA: hypothetical protein DEG17_23425 [Cyanobacteria bacterium UBA11149]|nr:hypothetical protein [Cyanobacteria bacterium UBA11153]HBW91733.1 hypothetical protein [Cyanobacteria bacterium UBA11149]